MKRRGSIALPEGIKKSDSFVTIFDHATGTATFLVEVIYQNDSVLFRQLAKCGGELRRLHLLEGVKPQRGLATFGVKGDNVIVSLSETIRLMQEINSVMMACGGFPDAFVG